MGLQPKLWMTRAWSRGRALLLLCLAKALSPCQEEEAHRGSVLKVWD